MKCKKKRSGEWKIILRHALQNSNINLTLNGSVSERTEWIKINFLGGKNRREKEWNNGIGGKEMWKKRERRQKKNVEKFKF